MDATFKKVMQLWAMATQSSRIPQDDIASGVYFAVMDEAPPAEVASIRDAVGLCDFIHHRKTGRSLSPAERADVGQRIEELSSAPAMPSFGAMRVLMALPNIVVGIAIFAVIFRSFSWVVLGVALFGKSWNGFARWLAGQGHPTAGIHIAIALLALGTALVLSFLHIFRILTVP